jgi:prepilin-type N-terminal cleavage/methylation domain-containing protein
MTLKNIKQQGFTIVELLIVIVVIAILAAITIVAYNGVQNRAKATSAQSAANNAIKKAELYNTEKSVYPATAAALTGAADSDVYKLTGVTFDLGTTAPANPTSLSFAVCPTTGTQTGVKIGYWKYDANPAALAYVTAGSGC